MTKIKSREYIDWRDAIQKGDTFRFDKIGGDRTLIMAAWTALKNYGEAPLGPQMLMLRDVAEGINGLVAKAAKFDELEEILNDTASPDRAVIERLAQVFYG
jgi:hypothetical protein